MFFFSDDEACSIMMSPFEKKLYLRQEDLLCSQAVDSQCEVRWDCTSPDAIRHLKKSKMFGSDRPSLKTFLSCLHFHFSVLFFGLKVLLICKISPNYTDLKCLLDIKVLTQQAKGAGTLAIYCSGESCE